MTVISRILFQRIQRGLQTLKPLSRETRNFATVNSATAKENSEEQKSNENSNSSSPGEVPLEYRFIYPEFLPDPNPLHRNAIREKLERMDMLARRQVVDIPEFYVGSIVSVTYTEPHAPGKTNRFVGICIDRKGCGLRATFTLRNVIDNQGVEVMFDMYDPAIQKVECLRLEKRLDKELFYLRDAPLEHSTFSFDMKPEMLPEGAPVPVNDIKITLNPRPWTQRWELKGLKGVNDLVPYLNERRKRILKETAKPWEKYDLMKIYRETIPEEEQREIFSEVYVKLHNIQSSRSKLKRSRYFTDRTKKST